MRSVNKPLLYFSFFLYLTLLVWIITFKCNLLTPISESMLILPKKTFLERISMDLHYNPSLLGMLRGRDFWLNVLAFLPLGIYLPLITEKARMLSGMLIASLLSFTFELIQAITCIGGFTLVDIATNTIGFLIGYVIFKLIIDRLPGSVINKINLAVAIVVTPICLYAVYNTVINWEIYTLEYYQK